MDTLSNYFSPSLIVAVIGWWILHALSISRDRSKKKHDIKTQYLIEAYRSLESCSNRSLTPEQSKIIENAMADIQLFGSKEQVELTQEFLTEFASAKTGSLDRLLVSLRNELRRDLGLTPVSNVKHLRIKH